MALGIRKLMVIGLVALIVAAANIMVIAAWLQQVGLIDWARWLQREFLTGTAITILIALLILLTPAGAGARGWLGRRCEVCGHHGGGRYCSECGSRR